MNPKEEQTNSDAIKFDVESSIEEKKEANINENARDNQLEEKS